jgi:hypothetical protein
MKYLTHYHLLFTALLLTSCANDVAVPPDSTPPSHAGQTTFSLTIGRTIGTYITNAEADRILAGATQVLSRADSAHDTPAQVRLQRSGDVRAVRGPSIINTPQDFADLQAAGRHIIIVDAINECGGYIPGIVGCAPVPDRFMALVRHHQHEDILWAHEFGHNRGLHHRDDTSAVMHPQLGSSRRSLTAQEASVYQGASAGPQAATLQPVEAPPASLDTYLNTLYIHGVPYSQVAHFDATHVSRLTRILADPAQQQRWSNAAIALATISTPQCLETIRSFIFKGQGRLSPAAYNAKRAALMALAYSVHKSTANSAPHQCQCALQLLRDSSTPQQWQKKLHWSGPTHLTTQQTIEQLTCTALAGLSLSGAPGALTHLQAARSSPAPILERAISELQKVQSLGISQYTARPRAHRE